MDMFHHNLTAIRKKFNDSANFYEFGNRSVLKPIRVRFRAASSLRFLIIHIVCFNMN